MIIRKSFRFKGTHRVFKCFSERCRESIHSHAYKVEIYLTSDKVDNGNMVMDFGLTKGTVKDFVDSFHNTLSLWSNVGGDFVNEQVKLDKRWVKMPVSPSAECYAAMFLYVIDKIVSNTQLSNGEGEVKVLKIRVHETETGYAEASIEDLPVWFPYTLNDIKFSEGVTEDWKDKEWWNKLLRGEKFINPIIKQQIEIK